VNAQVQPIFSQILISGSATQSSSTRGSNVFTGSKPREKAGQASRLPSERVSASKKIKKILGAAGETPAPLYLSNSSAICTALSAAPLSN
jgi:hypothetical protein